MKKQDVRIGKVYVVMVSGKLAPVRIDKELTREFGSPMRGDLKTRTHWLGTNLRTGRRIEIKSASKLRREFLEGPADSSRGIVEGDGLHERSSEERREEGSSSLPRSQWTPPVARLLEAAKEALPALRNGEQNLTAELGQVGCRIARIMLERAIKAVEEGEG